MSKDLNQCNFIGRLGRDVEVKYTQGGTAIANFSIACGDDYKDKSGQKVEKTNWIPVVIFGRLAEVAGEYLSKGSQVYISGKFTTRKWQDKDGQDRYSTEIVANEMQLLGGKCDSDDAPSDRIRTPPPAGQYAGDDFDDVIPFIDQYKFIWRMV